MEGTKAKALTRDITPNAHTILHRHWGLPDTGRDGASPADRGLAVIENESQSLLPTLFLCQKSYGVCDFNLCCCCFFPTSLFPGSPNPTGRQTDETSQTQEEEDLQITGTTPPMRSVY